MHPAVNNEFSQELSESCEFGVSYDRGVDRAFSFKPTKQDPRMPSPITPLGAERLLKTCRLENDLKKTIVFVDGKYFDSPTPSREFWLQVNQAFYDWLQDPDPAAVAAGSTVHTTFSEEVVNTVYHHPRPLSERSARHPESARLYPNR